MIRPVLHYPHPILKQACTDVPEEWFDPNQRPPLAEAQHGETAVEIVVNDMIETMHYNHGMGIAAPQIGIPRRIFVVDCSDLTLRDKNSVNIFVFVNPKISLSEEKMVNQEGCLSFPGVVERISRAREVTVTARNVSGDRFTISFSDDIRAVAVQHEYDHLEGRLMNDHVSRLTRRAIERKLRSARKKSTKLVR